MIISAPDENKEQEKFLGYKWSNRKGQEGIQITNAGGYLYNAADRRSNNSIAGLIRNAFSDEDEFDIEELDTYYYRLRLQDMLDFPELHLIKLSKPLKQEYLRIFRVLQITDYLIRNILI